MDETQYQRRIDNLTILLDVSKRMAATTELQPLLERVEQAALRVLDCERATVFLYDPAADELYSKVATGESEIRFSAKLGIAGHAAQTRSVINVPDAYADPRFNKEVDKKTGFKTRNLISFCLTQSGVWVDAEQVRLDVEALTYNFAGLSQLFVNHQFLAVGAEV